MGYINANKHAIRPLSCLRRVPALPPKSPTVPVEPIQLHPHHSFLTRTPPRSPPEPTVHLLYQPACPPAAKLVPTATILVPPNVTWGPVPPVLHLSSGRADAEIRQEVFGVLSFESQIPVLVEKYFVTNHVQHFVHVADTSAGGYVVPWPPSLPVLRKGRNAPEVSIWIVEWAKNRGDCMSVT